MAENLSKGKITAWFQGGSEYGSRALGNRSILGAPRSSEMQKNLNLKVKYRESFRPFAPSVLREDVTEWLKINIDSPYMLFVAKMKKEKTLDMSAEQKKLFGIDLLNIKRSEIPAVTHVDYSARIQTVHHETNPKFHQLLTEYEKQTGFGILINTSFNIRAEPIVCSPEDAYKCFMGTELDVLVMNNIILLKEEQ